MEQVSRIIGQKQRKKRRPDWGRLFNIEEAFSCYFMTLMVEVLPSV